MQLNCTVHTIEVEAVGGRAARADGLTPLTTPRRKPGDGRRRFRWNPNKVTPCTCLASLYDRLSALYDVLDTQNVIIGRADIRFDSLVLPYDAPAVYKPCYSIVRAFESLYCHDLVQGDLRRVKNSGCTITTDGTMGKSVFAKDTLPGDKLASGVELEFYNKPLENPQDPAQARLEMRFTGCYSEHITDPVVYLNEAAALLDELRGCYDLLTAELYTDLCVGWHTARPGRYITAAEYIRDRAALVINRR